MSASDVVDQFTRQVETFAHSPHATHRESLDVLAALVGPATGARVLDVCCGPGIVSCHLAPHVAEVVGVDLTPAMTARAAALAADKGLSNARFQVADALTLPFPDASFDVAVSRFALHQIERPDAALAEQARVVRPGGLVIAFDTMTSEDRAEANYHNEVARLREPVHARVLSLSDLVQLFAMAGLDAERFVALSFTIGVETWIAQAHAPEESRDKARRMFRAAVGTRKFGGRRVFEEDGELKYVARWGVLAGRRRDGSGAPT